MDPNINHCFGCGPENPVGLHLSFEVELSEQGVWTSRADVLLDRNYQGGTDFLHGGILATLMDEAMSKLNHPLGVKAMTRQMEVNYLRPSPVGQTMKLIGTHLRREGRKLFHGAELRDAGGAVLVQGTGLFIVISGISET